MSFLCCASRRRPSTMPLEGPDRGIILFRELSSRQRSVTRLTHAATSPETRCRRDNLLPLANDAYPNEYCARCRFVRLISQ